MPMDATRPTLADFIGQVYGTIVTAPAGVGGECVDLADLYALLCYGTPHVYRNAVDWAQGSIPGWGWIPNQPTNYPHTGDLVVWGASAAAGTGPNGHIAIALSASSMKIVSVDQNWPRGSPVTLRLHSYDGVLGWLRKLHG